MKKHPKRKLQLENLEERKLTAALSYQLTSLFSAPQTTTALVNPYSTYSSGGLTYGSYSSAFKPGISVNHNETLVCLRNRSDCRRCLRAGR
jgi:hypothetical protein